MARAGRHRLRAHEADAARGVGVEVEAAEAGQDLAVAMARRELAEAAGLVVDAELEVVVGAGLDEVVGEVARERLAVARRRAAGRLLAHPRLVLGRHELAPG